MKLKIQKIKVVWEDKNIVVVNKPAGVVVDAVASWAWRNLPLEGLDDAQMKQRGGLAHRLDKETSGVLLLAKNPLALKHLMDQFKKRVIKKEYIALAHGKLEPGKGVIKLPIRRNPHNRKQQEIHYQGKRAETAWEVKGYLKEFSLVRVMPKTGRMHQIRVHLAHLGHAIFADAKYLGKKKRMEDRKLLSHHFLHAEKIGFFDLGGKWREVGVGMPAENEKILADLGRGENRPDFCVE